MPELVFISHDLPINDIFAKYGEDYFRDIESNLILDIGKEGNTIVSCGGGVVVRSQNRMYMKNSGLVIYLCATPLTIYERVKDSRERPILNGNMNVEYIAGLMEVRRPFYEKAASVIIDTSHMRIDQVAEAVLTAVSAAE